jgi:hypothetical protein
MKLFELSVESLNTSNMFDVLRDSTEQINQILKVDIFHVNSSTLYENSYDVKGNGLNLLSFYPEEENQPAVMSLMIFDDFCESLLLCDERYICFTKNGFEVLNDSMECVDLPHHLCSESLNNQYADSALTYKAVFDSLCAVVNLEGYEFSL